MVHPHDVSGRAGALRRPALPELRANLPAWTVARQTLHQRRSRTMTTREYGLLIASRNSYGTDYITATVVVREDGGDSPLNPWSDGECSYYGTPKHLDGLQLDGFGMHGHVMTGNDPAYIG